MNLIWTPLALQRLEDIANYIAFDSPRNAYKFVNMIFEKVEILIEFPNIGRIVPELINNQYRELIFDNYRIIYK